MAIVSKELTKMMNPQANRYWQNNQFNPILAYNKEQNNNPMLPNFYHGPKMAELFGEHCNCEQKIMYYLKNEIDEYRTTQKHLKYTKKDLMIRMLIDEVEKQHKRISFLEGKVQAQKLKIGKLEDAVFQNRSHRLLLRCTSSN